MGFRAFWRWLEFTSQAEVLGIEQVITAARSPWQNPYVERLIDTIRQEYLDHVIVLEERHLRRIRREYVEYYDGTRTHLGLGKEPVGGRASRDPADQKALDGWRAVSSDLSGGGLDAGFGGGWIIW